LKHRVADAVDADEVRRDTQKTQHGIETKRLWLDVAIDENVETLRKPSTGLKLKNTAYVEAKISGRDTQKTQHGIETGRA